MAMINDIRDSLVLGYFESSDGYTDSSSDSRDRTTLQTTGNFTSNNGKEYIKVESPSSVNMPQLGFSARLTYDHWNLAIHNEGSLLVTDDNFVAQVKLNRPHLLTGTPNFQQATEVLLNELRIDRVLLDDVTADRDQKRELFLTSLEDVIKELAADQGQSNRRNELLTFIERSKQSYVQLCYEVRKHFLEDETLHKHAEILESIELKVSQRERLFQRFRHCPKDNSPNLTVRLDRLVGKIVEDHSSMLLTTAPAYLHKLLSTVSPRKLLLISSSDMKLFADMTSALEPEIFEKPLQHLANRWFNQINYDQFISKPRQLTSVSLFFICKSLEELIIEIAERSNHRATDLLTSTNLGWSPIKRIVWKTENVFTKCLEKEYEFIFRLLKHLTTDFGLQSFEYKMQLFNNHQLTHPKKNPFGVPDDFYIWYCLLDDVLFHVLPKDFEPDLLDKVLEGYVQMIRDAKYDQMDTLRVATHNLTRFITLASSCIKEESLDRLQDIAIFQKQLDTFNFRTNQTAVPSNNFRDLVDVFSRFWIIRNEIIAQFPMKINLPEMIKMCNRLMEIMLIVMGKNIEMDALVAFYRTYIDFVLDINKVSLDWYIKDVPELDMQSFKELGKVEVVDNKWKDNTKRTYRVLDPENFPSLCKGSNETVDVPKHYVIQVLQTLLEHISSQLERSKWATDESLSDTDQVLSTNELIFAIRTSLVYLNEQIDYNSFDLFYDERVKPFISVLETTTSRQDFSNRIYVIKESFWHAVYTALSSHKVVAVA